jgi:glycosyltransferase involved in cell wall biosynthesis
VRVAAVADGNDVAAARVLAATLREHHPDWRLSVLVLPGLRPAVHAPDEPFDVVTANDLGLAGLDRLLTATPPGPLGVLMRAVFVQRLLEDGEPVLLLPADAEARGRLDALLEGDSDVTLVPRLLGSLPDDSLRPDGRDLLEAGEIDDELVLVRPTATGRAFADWWVERGHDAAEQGGILRTAPGVAPPAARLGASPLGAARTVFPGIRVLDDPAIGVSHWNLHERDPRDARLIRFTGFRADRPWWLSEAATRVPVVDDPVLSEMLGRRSAALLEAGWMTAATLGERHTLGNGLIFDERLRRLHAAATDAGEDFGDLFSPAGAEGFLTWLREPAPAGAVAGINRYSHDVWRQRPDVQEAYPDLDGADAEGFIGWLWVHGRPELRLQEPLLPPAPEWVEGVERHVPPVLVTGYLRGNLGLGEAARGYVHALQAAEVPVATRSVATDPPVERLPRGAKPRPEEREFDELVLPDGIAPEVHLLCVNADQVPGFAADFGEQELRSRYTIGHWAWETDEVPERWDAAFDLVDEIWVNSTWVAENLGRAGDVPTVVIPTPVERPDPAGARLPFELPDGFVFLFAFDYFSILERKNPLALVEAFTRAFAPGEGPALVLKTINAEFRPEAHDRLRWAVGGRDDIHLLDVTLPPDQMAALFARADAYVSLHRAEGYGITLAESMALGKPVIATGWSGNTDFMTPANSYLVDSVIRDVGPDAEHYPPDGHWAEPSVEHAAALMREVWEDPEGARARGARAAADVAANLSVQAVGAIARARLERIAVRQSGRTASGRLPYPLDEVVRRLHFDVGAGEADGARGKAKAAVMRALRPYALAQRHLDEAVAASLQRLHVELEAERAARTRDRDRIARLERRLAELTQRRP